MRTTHLARALRAATRGVHTETHGSYCGGHIVTPWTTEMEFRTKGCEVFPTMRLTDVHGNVVPGATLPAVAEDQEFVTKMYSVMLRIQAMDKVRPRTSVARRVKSPS